MRKTSVVCFVWCVTAANAFSIPTLSFKHAVRSLGLCRYVAGSCSLTSGIAESAEAKTSKTRVSPLHLQAALGKKSTAKDVIDAFGVDLKGKTALVTGCAPLHVSCFLLHF